MTPSDAQPAALADAQLESLEDFRARARTWITQNLRPRPESAPLRREARQAGKALQAKIYDAGFAGLAVPKAYGGAGLTLEHQRVWADETRAYETPRDYMVSIGMMLPTVLDHGSEAVKRRHIPRMLRGEEQWIQLLSEPSGGSDMAGALTRAERRDGAYVITGSKMWSSGAGTADYGLCLARVNWDAPKHQGLGMFALPLKAKGVTINPIIPAQGGEAHFFIEYLDEVEVPEDYVLGGEGAGWTVAQRLLFHERNATAGVGYGLGLGGGSSNGGFAFRLDILDLARRHGVTGDPALAARIADDYVELVVGEQLANRINGGMRMGKLQGQWGSLLKLGMGIDCPENADLALAVAGADGVVWSGDNEGGEVVKNWLRVRGISIAGGSNEMQRNIVSERLMGLPREPGDDKSLPFNELIQRAKARG
jgi:alkylation response protein AidB-like acyl-CoA dehydrogenase